MEQSGPVMFPCGADLHTFTYTFQVNLLRKGLKLKKKTSNNNIQYSILNEVKQNNTGLAFQAAEGILPYSYMVNVYLLTSAFCAPNIILLTI